MGKGRHRKPKDNIRKAAMGAAVLGGGVVVPMTFVGSASAAQYTPEQTAAAAMAGCPSLNADQLNMAVKIAGAESGLNTDANAAGAEDSRGLWQINAGVHGSPWGDLYDPVTNARAMCDLSSGGNDWTPWSAYLNGSYQSKDGFTGDVAAPVPVDPPKQEAPAPADPAPTEKPAPTPAEKGETNTVVVKEGDTLWGLSPLHDWKPVYEANKAVIGDNPDYILPGEKLVIGGEVKAEAPAPKPEAPKPAETPAPAPATGDYVSPVDGTITQNFHNPDGRYGLGYHTGVDIGAPNGSPVRSVSAGIVVDINGAGSAYHNSVSIKHDDGTYTLSAHMTSTTVSVGQRVDPGTQIGTVGAGHLHLELRNDPTAYAEGVFSDPIPWLASHGVNL